MRPYYSATQAKREDAACPHITPDEAEKYASQGFLDALDLICDVHDLDTRQTYGRLALWGREDPSRLVTVAFALALMHDPNTPGSVLERNLNAVARHQGAA